MGNSGQSSEPHIQLQAEGLPIYFKSDDESYMPNGGGDK